MDRRAAVTQAARLEFSETGFAGARIERIAARAGVNKQLIYYYFGSKRGLYQSVVEEAIDQALPADRGHDSEGGSEFGALRRHLTKIFDNLSQGSAAQLILADLLRNPTGEASGFFRDERDRLSAIVSDAQGVGHFRDDVDPELVARQALVLVLGFFALEHHLGTQGKTPPHSEWRDGVIDLLTRAMTW